MRRLIDAWWPHIEAGAEAIVFSASGCGVMLRDYAHVLAGDERYLEKARRVVALSKDVGEVLFAERDRLLALERTSGAPALAAFHAPCTLQHGLRSHALVQGLLRDLGFTLTPVPEAHLCCGSAGTYSILQPQLARQLLARKLAALTSGKPRVILTANIGCLVHLQSQASIPVRHWIEAVDERLC